MSALYDVVSFGEAMLRLSPPAGTRLEDARAFNGYVAGSESNVLACLSRLGLRCAWVSALPSNPLGRHIAAELRRHGVDTSAVVWLEGDARLGLYYAEESAGPLGVQVMYDRAHSACALLDPERIDLSIVERARLFHLTGITPAISETARETFLRLLRRARERGVTVSFDVNYRAKLWSPDAAAAGIEEACRTADILFCTRHDAVELWGFTGGAASILEQMAQRFGGDRIIVLTLGGEGAMQLRQGRCDAAPAFPSDGAIRFGSGDAFAAGYLSAYLDSPLYSGVRDEGGVSALRIGNAIAALKRCIAGDIAVVTQDDVLALIRQGEGGRFR